MPTKELRSEAIEWKRSGLAVLRELISALKGTRKDVDRVLGGAKGSITQLCRVAEAVAKKYDRTLDDQDEDYDRDSNAMDAMREVPNIDDQADEAREQISDALDELITRLEEVKDAVEEVTP